MPLPLFPELPADSPLLHIQQRLLHLRQALEETCQDLDEQIAALGAAPVEPAARPARPQPSQAHLEAAAEFTRRLFEADPVCTPESPPELPAAETAEHLEAMTEARIIEATPACGLDPDLERATLEELNSALSAAFEQISKNKAW